MLALARCRGRFAGIVVHRPPPPPPLFFWGASPSSYSPLLARTVEVVVVPRTITCAVGTWMAE